MELLDRILEPGRRLMWRMSAGEPTIVGRALRPITRLLERVGYRFEFIGGFTLRAVPDGDLYRPTYAPWSQETCAAELRIGDRRSLVSPERRYFLVRSLRQTLRAAEGNVAECGVYRGGTAYLLANVMTDEAPGRILRLFDTFAGMPETDARRDVHRPGDFADTGLTDVQQYLSPFPNVEFHVGTIPQTFDNLPNERYAFVHIDLDIYSAVRDATQYFYAKLSPGGLLVYDDYGLRSCPGARQAVDEFFADKPEIPIVLSSGHCFAQKI